LAEVEFLTEKRAAGVTKPDPAIIKGKIVEYAWWMKKEGYARKPYEETRAVKELCWSEKLISWIQSPSKKCWPKRNHGVKTDAETLLTLTRYSLKFIGYNGKNPSVR